MNDALREQLLKAGFKQSKPEPKPKHRSKPKQHHKSSKGKKPNSDLAKAYALRAKAEKEELRIAQQQAALKKKNNATIRSLIQKKSLNDEKADLEYNFTAGTTIKKVYVTEEQKKLLAEGKLGITFSRGKRHVINTETIEEIRALNPEKLIIQNNTSEVQKNELEENYPAVPDDLDW